MNVIILVDYGFYKGGGETRCVARCGDLHAVVIRLRSFVPPARYSTS